MYNTDITIQSIPVFEKGFTTELRNTIYVTNKKVYCLCLIIDYIDKMSNCMIRLH